MGRKKLVRKPEPEHKIAWPRWTGFRGKTVWDWMQLLIVPLVITVLGLSFATAQQVISNLQQEVRQQQLENQRTRFEIALAEQQGQYEVLKAYLDVMKELLLEQDLRDSGPDSSVRAVASAQTLLILERADARNKRVVLRLLTDSHLIDGDAPIIEMPPTLDLQNVDARGMDLSNTDLSRANLEHTNLEGANLEGANLKYADLSGADLSRSYLIEANLNGADLSRADLSNAQGITNEEIEQQAKTLEGATMPNGQKYEDWLKSKNREEGGKNAGSS